MAAHAKNVALTPELERWVDELVTSGEYRSASEVMRDGLRALKERRERHATELEEIRERIRRGVGQADRGEFVDGTLEEVVGDSFERARQRVRQAK